MIQEKGYYEINQFHNAADQPVAAFAGNIIYNGLHWHDHIEILLCKTGSFHVRAEGQIYSMHTGDLLLINSRIPHEIYDGHPGKLQIVCSVKKDALRDMDHSIIAFGQAQDPADPCSDSRGNLILLTGYEEPLREDFLELRHLVEHLACLPMHAYKLKLSGENETEAESCSLLNLADQYRLLALLAKYKRKDPQPQTKSETLVSSCIRYLHEHIAEPLSAAVLAKELHVSEPTIYRLFYRQIGVHLNSYITTLRIQTACRMLQNPETRVIDAAYASGFTGMSNFYRVFRQQVGMTPKEYQHTHPVVLTPSLFEQPDIMRMNQYQNFFELDYTPEDLLKNFTC